MGYAILIAVVVLTFLISGAWWVSGWQGGSVGEPTPLGVTAAAGIVAGLILYAMGMLP